MAKRAKKDAPPSKVDSKAAPGTLETGGEVELSNWADKPDSEAYIAAAKMYDSIVKAYQNQEDRADNTEEFWAIFNAQPDENQQYSGNSQCYVPAVRDALNARAKRTVKQLFPASHRHVDAISADATVPYPQLSLLEHYIRKTRLKDTVRTDLIAGDVTGQWNLYIDWTKSYRRVTEIITKNPIVEQIDGENVSDLGLEDPLGEAEEDTKTESVIDEGPDIVAFADEDLAVVPPTCSDLQKARAAAIRLRMSEDKFQQMVDEGVFVIPQSVRSKDGKAAPTAADFFAQQSQGSQGRSKKNPAKRATSDAGIRTDGTDKHALIFEAYMDLPFEEDQPKEPAIVYYAGPQEIVGIIKSPYWSGKRPMISNPVDKITGSFKGRSKIDPVKFLQWNLNMFWNMGMDSAMYGLLPVFTADPMKNPNWAAMTLGLAAVWPIAPTDIKAMQFPAIYKDAVQLCDAIKRQIWESLEVNEMMMGRMPAGRKNNQLMGAMQQEQQTNISDHAERYEECMLNPLVEMLYELDQQFRTRSVTVKARGELGVKANMVEVHVQQWGEKYFFRWSGTEFMLGQQRIQQQIAALNVLKGIPPQQLGGFRLNVAPFAQNLVENAFGPDVGQNILVDERNMFTVDADTENEMLHNGFDVPVHESDNDPEHLQKHMRGAALAGDLAGKFKTHMAMHMQSMQKKREMAAGQQPGAKGLPGAPGGAGPGVAGTPQPGGQPGMPRGAQNPPGAIHSDQMADGAMPGRG